MPRIPDGQSRGPEGSWTWGRADGTQAAFSALGCIQARAPRGQTLLAGSGRRLPRAGTHTAGSIQTSLHSDGRVASRAQGRTSPGFPSTLQPQCSLLGTHKLAALLPTHCVGAELTDTPPPGGGHYPEPEVLAAQQSPQNTPFHLERSPGDWRITWQQ